MARAINCRSAHRGSEFIVNAYTTSIQIGTGVAMDSQGDFVVDWYGYGAGPGNTTWQTIYARQYQLEPTGSTFDDQWHLVQRHVAVTFPDATDFSVTLNGGSPPHIRPRHRRPNRLQRPRGWILPIGVRQPFHAFTATQSFGSTMLKSSKFWFTANSVTNLYIYGNGSSTARVNVATGTESDFFVDDPAAPTPTATSAIRPRAAIASFRASASETVTGSAGTTYAYIYSTSHASTVASPTQTTFTARRRDDLR